MKVLSFCLITFLSLTLFSAPRGHGVGNGGDGYFMRQTGKVVLRDLVEVGASETVISLNAPSEARFLRNKHVLVESALLQKKLARKLTDVNLAMRGLGDLLQVVMNSYTWVLVDAQLELVPHQETVLGDIEGAELRQLANRLGGIVRIHRPSWILMSDENKIGLILHECLEALLTPKVQPEGYWSQSNLKARELTGLLFYSELIEQGPAIFKATFLPELNLPWAEISAFAGAMPVVITGTSQSWTILFTGDPQEFEALLQNICREENRQILIQSRLRPYELTFESYESEFGAQLYPKVRVRPQQLFELPVLLPLPFEACTQSLAHALRTLRLEL